MPSTSLGRSMPDLTPRPETRRPLVHAVHAQHVPQRVEVHVARLLDGVPHVDRAMAPLEVALEVATVECPAPGAVHLEIRCHDALFEGRDRDGNLEGRAWGVSPLHDAVLQGSQLVGVERGPRGAIDPAGKRVGVVRRQTHQRQHLPASRVDGRRRAPEAQGLEAVFGRFLHVVVDGQLQSPPFGRLDFVERPDLAAQAVDDDRAGAVRAHQVAVVRALDAGLSDDGAGLEVVGRQLRVGGLADVAEQVRGHRVGGIPPRRHALDDHVGEFEVEAARHDRRHLRQARILDHDDGAIRRQVAGAIDDLAHVVFLDSGHRREHPDRPIEVGGMEADDRDGVTGPVLDEDLAVAVEQHAARRPQRQLALVVVLRHLAKLLVLDDLEEPEGARQQEEADDDGHLQDRDAGRRDFAGFAGAHGVSPDGARSACRCRRCAAGAARPRPAATRWPGGRRCRPGRWPRPDRARPPTGSRSRADSSNSYRPMKMPAWMTVDARNVRNRGRGPATMNCVLASPTR